MKQPFLNIFGVRVCVCVCVCTMCTYVQVYAYVNEYVQGKVTRQPKFTSCYLSPPSPPFPPFRPSRLSPLLRLHARTREHTARTTPPLLHTTPHHTAMMMKAVVM
mmetsp:Transcript_29012/g.74487  ORF Transcript_29012/g.74487 Transcript_29012/m.74487 type:complete len:105 (+) Transcript_29012:329-643(+)